ncbi:MAG: hypothetical protein RBS48_04545 [Ignavibacteriaceae bacterium]|nr:hypothetical protein [Ignavibacteriaceae bacterium]
MASITIIGQVMRMFSYGVGEIEIISKAKLTQEQLAEKPGLRKVTF